MINTEIIHNWYATEKKDLHSMKSNRVRSIKEGDGARAFDLDISIAYQEGVCLALSFVLEEAKKQEGQESVCLGSHASQDLLDAIKLGFGCGYTLIPKSTRSFGRPVLAKSSGKLEG